MFSIENMCLVRYAQLVTLGARLKGLFTRPMAYLTSINVMAFKKANAGGAFNTPTDVWVAKHRWVPKPVRPFWFWSTCTRVMYGMDFDCFVSLDHIRRYNFLSACEWLAYNRTGTDSCYIAGYYLFGNASAVKAVTSTPRYKKRLKAWMGIAHRFIDPMHPFVEALRFAYLAGDIEKDSYMELFPRATAKDNEAPVYDRGQQLPDATSKFVAPNLKRDSGMITAKYLDLFGNQYETPFK